MGPSLARLFYTKFYGRYIQFEKGDGTGRALDLGVCRLWAQITSGAFVYCLVFRAMERFGGRIICDANLLRHHISMPEHTLYSRFFLLLCNSKYSYFIEKFILLKTMLSQPAKKGNSSA